MGSTTATLVGNVGSEVIEIASGAGVKFRLAAGDRYQDRRTGEWTDGKVFWVDVVCWGRLADGVKSSIRKGDPVVVCGRLETDEYTVDGQSRRKTQFSASTVGHDLARGTSSFRRTARKDDRAGLAAPPPFDPGDDEELAEPADREDAAIATAEDDGLAYTLR